MVENGDACLNILGPESKFDLIFLDIKMPGQSGLEILKQIKGSNPNQKIIVATGYRSVETANEALKLGATDYVIKPFDIADIREAVKRVMG